MTILKRTVQKQAFFDQIVIYKNLRYRLISQGVKP
jgi:hypothetical protein